jgi:hypothetical protein
MNIFLLQNHLRAIHTRNSPSFVAPEVQDSGRYGVRGQAVTMQLNDGWVSSNENTTPYTITMKYKIIVFILRA